MSEYLAENSENEESEPLILKPYQALALKDVLSKIQQGEKTGYVEMATSTGKTAVMSKLTELFLLSSQGKVLFLAPSIQICQQIAHEISKFTEISGDDSTFLFGDHKPADNARVIIGTYQSYLTRGKELEGIGLVLADECHRSLGPLTSRTMLNSHQDCYKVGFSATPNFRLNRRSEEIFGNVMHKFDLREAIEAGIAQLAEAYVYRTGTELELKQNTGELTYDELEPLIRDVARNQAGINLAKELVADGRQGIINCVKGKSNGHARAIAEILSNTTVKTTDGQERKITAAAVGNHLTKAEQDLILKKYEAGEIDILTFTKALEEGWNSHKASFAINMVPTTSELKVKQLIGRILRKKTDDPRPSIYIDLVDEQQYYKRSIYTGLHALEFVFDDNVGSGMKAQDKLISRHIYPMPKPEDKRYQKDIDNYNLFNKLISSLDELQYFERLGRREEEFDVLQLRQYRDLRDAVFPYNEAQWRYDGRSKNRRMAAHPQRLNPGYEDILSIDKLTKYADELLVMDEDDNPHYEIDAPENTDIDELLNRVAEITNGRSLPAHMGHTLLANMQCFDTNELSYSMEHHPNLGEQQPGPFNQLLDDSLKEQIAQALVTLNEREAGVIRMRFGLFDDEPKTLDEIGKVYGFTRERIRQIESKTMSKLRHPDRSRRLREYLGQDDTYTYMASDTTRERPAHLWGISRIQTMRLHEVKARILEETDTQNYPPSGDKETSRLKSINWAARLLSDLSDYWQTSPPMAIDYQASSMVCSYLATSNRQFAANVIRAINDTYTYYFQKKQMQKWLMEAPNLEREKYLTDFSQLYPNVDIDYYIGAPAEKLLSIKTIFKHLSKYEDPKKIEKIAQKVFQERPDESSICLKIITGQLFSYL